MIALFPYCHGTELIVSMASSATSTRVFSAVNSRRYRNARPVGVVKEALMSPVSTPNLASLLAGSPFQSHTASHPNRDGKVRWRCAEKFNGFDEIRGA